MPQTKILLDLGLPAIPPDVIDLSCVPTGCDCFLGEDELLPDLLLLRVLLAPRLAAILAVT